MLSDDLQEANQVKAYFFSILNHNLRAPISNVIKLAHSQQTKDVVLDESTKKRLGDQTIKAAASLLISMEDLLLWSKGQMKNFKPL